MKTKLLKRVREQFNIVDDKNIRIVRLYFIGVLLSSHYYYSINERIKLIGEANKNIIETLRDAYPRLGAFNKRIKQ